MPTSNIPKHIAFIMDGNGRWAQDKGLPRSVGHRQGAQRIKEIVKAAREFGVEAVTFFAFSTENWKRPKKEIDILMRLLDNFLSHQIKQLIKDNVRFKVIGRYSPLPEKLVAKIKEFQKRTQDNTGLSVVLALNYGSRQEIMDAVKAVAVEIAQGRLLEDELNEEKFSSYLYTAGLPDPDLLIRTSGEMRISNFLLWQLSYAELYFPKIYWPDFDKQELEKALKAYEARERRFGRVKC